MIYLQNELIHYISRKLKSPEQLINYGLATNKNLINSSYQEILQDFGQFHLNFDTIDEKFYYGNYRNYKFIKSRIFELPNFVLGNSKNKKSIKVVKKVFCHNIFQVNLNNFNDFKIFKFMLKSEYSVDYITGKYKFLAFTNALRHGNLEMLNYLRIRINCQKLIDKNSSAIFLNMLMYDKNIKNICNWFDKFFNFDKHKPTNIISLSLSHQSIYFYFWYIRKFNIGLDQIQEHIIKCNDIVILGLIFEEFKQDQNFNLILKDKFVDNIIVIKYYLNVSKYIYKKLKNAKIQINFKDFESQYRHVTHYESLKWLDEKFKIERKDISDETFKIFFINNLINFCEKSMKFIINKFGIDQEFVLKFLNDKIFKILSHHHRLYLLKFFHNRFDISPIFDKIYNICKSDEPDVAKWITEENIKYLNKY